MEDHRSAVPVGVVRERVIQRLTEAFANDLITVAELEDRLQQAYQARTAAEAEALIVGLPGATAGQASMVASGPPSLSSLEREPRRFLSIFSSQSRRGIWTVPRQLDVVGLFSDTTIDLTQAMLPPDLVDIELSVVFANMKIVIPPGLRVVNRIGAFAANVESAPSLDLAPMKPGSPVIRLTGNVVFGNVEIVAGRTLEE
jgi:hypothetical protein